MRKAAAVSLLVLALLPLQRVLPFTATLPAGLPSMQGWEKITGEVVLDNSSCGSTAATAACFSNVS